MYDDSVQLTKDIVKSTQNGTVTVESCRSVKMRRIRSLFNTVELVHRSVKISLLGQRMLIKKKTFISLRQKS